MWLWCRWWLLWWEKTLQFFCFFCQIKLMCLSLFRLNMKISMANQLISIKKNLFILYQSSVIWMIKCHRILTLLLINRLNSILQIFFVSSMRNRSKETPFFSLISLENRLKTTCITQIVSEIVNRILVNFLHHLKCS